MNARLFFAMLSKGRVIERRRKFRDFFELRHVAAFPHYTKESQAEVMDYFYDNSLSNQEIALRRQVLVEAEEKAKAQESFDSPYRVAQLFRAASRGLQ